MQLYHWISKYMRNYGHGHVIVMASDVETARQIVMDGFEALDRERYDWDYESEWGDLDAIEDRRHQLRMDISTDPRIADPAVIFIAGSE